MAFNSIPSGGNFPNESNLDLNSNLGVERIISYSELKKHPSYVPPNPSPLVIREVTSFTEVVQTTNFFTSTPIIGDPRFRSRGFEKRPPAISRPHFLNQQSRNIPNHIINHFNVKKEKDVLDPPTSARSYGNFVDRSAPNTFQNHGNVGEGSSSSSQMMRNQPPKTTFGSASKDDINHLNVKKGKNVLDPPTSAHSSGNFFDRSAPNTFRNHGNFGEGSSSSSQMTRNQPPKTTLTLRSSASEDDINPLLYDGMTHSLPFYPKGTYGCPKCLRTFDRSQTFAAHMQSHYKTETKEERARRWAAKYRKRRLRLRLFETPVDGLTAVRAGSSNNVIGAVNIANTKTSAVAGGSAEYGNRLPLLETRTHGLTAVRAESSNGIGAAKIDNSIAAVAARATAKYLERRMKLPLLETPTHELTAVCAESSNGIGAVKVDNSIAAVAARATAKYLERRMRLRLQETQTHGPTAAARAESSNGIGAVKIGNNTSGVAAAKKSPLRGIMIKEEPIIID